MSITNLKCNRGCCSLKTTEWKRETEDDEIRLNSNKSGVILFDAAESEILLIQSRGNLWGMPKGTLEEGESPETGAIREAYEETGIKLDSESLGKSIVLDSATYFMVPYEKTEVDIQKQDHDNDATGIGWIKLSCLTEMLQNDRIRLTSHAHKIIRKINFTI